MDEKNTELIKQARRVLNITWSDDDVDKTLNDHIGAGIAVITRDCGVIRDDFLSRPEVNMLLMAYVRRAYDGDVSDFRADYRTEILALQVDRKVKKYVEQNAENV